MNTTLPEVDAPKEWEFTYRRQIMTYLATEKCNTSPIVVCDRRNWDPSFHKDTHKILNDLKETSYDIGWLKIKLNAKWKTKGKGGLFYNTDKGMPEFLSHYKDLSTDAHYVLTREAPVQPGVLAEVLSSENKFMEISTESKREVEEMKNNAWAYFLINNIAEDWIWEVGDHSADNTIITMRYVNENGTFERNGMSVKEIELTLFVLGPLKGKFDSLLVSMFNRYIVSPGLHWFNFWHVWVTHNAHVMKKLDPYLRKNVSKQFIALAQHYIVHEFKSDGIDRDVKEFVERIIND